MDEIFYSNFAICSDINKTYMRIKAIILVLILLLVLFSEAAQMAYSAKLFLLSPAQMVSKSQLIVRATVLEASMHKTALGNMPVGRFRITAIVKGSFKYKEFQVASHAIGPDQFLQQIPPPQTDVLVFLIRSSSKYSHETVLFTADNNNIGIIKNNSVVDIYRGTDIKLFPYSSTYNNVLQQYIKKHEINYPFTSFNSAQIGILSISVAFLLLLAYRLSQKRRL